MRLVLIWFFFLTLCFLPYQAWAGFGFSPAAIENKNLLPGSVFTVPIQLSRDSTQGEQTITPTVLGDMAAWVSWDPAAHFSPGQKTISLPVTVRVPSRTDKGNYRGSISFTYSEASPTQPLSDIHTGLGAHISLNFTVTDQTYTSFQVRHAGIYSAWGPQHFLGLKEPGKILVSLAVKNDSNVHAAPSKIVMALHDAATNQLIEKVETANIPNTPPFTEREITIPLSHTVRPGEYYAYLTVLQKYRPISDKPYKLHLDIKEPEIYTVSQHIIELLRTYKIIWISLLFCIPTCCGAIFWSVRTSKKQENK